MNREDMELLEDSHPEESHGIDDLDIDVPVEEEKIYVASYWQLMWWRFRKHKMAIISLIVLFLFYLVALFPRFVAPYDPEESFVKYKLAPPSNINIIDTEGQWQRPFVYKIVRSKDPETLRNLYTEDTSVIYPILFFVRGSEYKVLGLFWKGRAYQVCISVPGDTAQ